MKVDAHLVKQYYARKCRKQKKKEKTKKEKQSESEDNQTARVFMELNQFDIMQPLPVVRNLLSMCFFLI